MRSPPPAGEVEVVLLTRAFSKKMDYKKVIRVPLPQIVDTSSSVELYNAKKKFLRECQE